MGRLDQSLEKQLGLAFDPPHSGFTSDLPDNKDFSTSRFASISTGAGRSSPKKRQTLNDDEPIDPNEPVYCFCNQVSFGDMIACDNPNCSREWFHYPCVGLQSPPKGKWYCRECEPLMKLQS